MALKQRLIIMCSLIGLFCSAVLIYDLWQWNQTRRYNTAIEQAQFAEAGSYKGDYGLFAKAYAEQQAENFQDALILYSRLEKTNDKTLRLAVLFNVGNTYLQQASTFDLEKDSDQAFPLIELAKVSYRELLRIDSQHWDTKYNLERALQLLPDLREKTLIKVDGVRGAVRTIISADTEDNLP